MPKIVRIYCSVGLAVFFAAQWPAPAAEQEGAMAANRLKEVIVRLEAEEAKVRDVDYRLRIVTRKADPKTGAEPREVVADDHRRVVLQGKRIYYRRQGKQQVHQT